MNHTYSHREGVLNSDGTLRDKATIELVQPSRRMTRGMAQNPGLGQDQSIGNS